MATSGALLFWCLPVALLLAEAAAVILLSRRRVRYRRVWVIGSYLALVALAVSIHYAGPDEFGYGIIPTILITAPWYLLPPFRGLNILGCIVIGFIFNCIVFFVLDRVSYPEDSEQSPAPPSDQETHVIP